MKNAATNNHINDNLLKDLMTRTKDKKTKDKGGISLEGRGGFQELMPSGGIILTPFSNKIMVFFLWYGNHFYGFFNRKGNII